MSHPAGKLTARVSLERDELKRIKGVDTRVPVVYSKAWARIDALEGREYYAAQQVNSEVKWRITMNYRTDVEASDRVIFGTLRFEVIAPQPDLAKKEKLVLLCRTLNN